MPVEHFTNLDSTAKIDCDVCIIGSGPAGATIAQELSNTRWRVTLVESGGFERQEAVDQLNEIESVGWPRVMDQWLVRNRIVGGSSHTWRGRCAPFDQIDFERRDWVPYSGWPFGLDDLAPFLDRALSLAGLSSSPMSDHSTFWERAGRSMPQPQLNTQDFHSYFWQFSRDVTNRSDYMRFGPRLVKEAGPNINLLLNATVLQINVNAEASRTASVQVGSMDGQRRTIAAPIVVLCAGAIENARILLSSNQIVNVGLGNGRDLVGRFLMDHMRGPVASFELKGSEQLQKRFGHYRVRDKEGGHVFSHGIRPTPEVQRREGLLNCALWLEGNITADDPWNAMKRLLRGNINIRNDIAAVAGNFGLLARGLNDYFLERRGLPRKIDRLSLVCMSEQQPDPDSRVTLAETCDQFGLRKARVDWRINQSEQRTFQRAARLAVEAFSRAGLPRPRLEPWVQRKEPFPEDFRDVAHPIGTTRMGDDPTTSVVSSTCEVHGISGLYVAGSSVFPTGGHANPTLTIVAMALRLADTIKLRLQQTWAPMPHARIIPETFMGSDKQATEVSSGRSAPFLPHSRSSVQGLESRGGNHP